jgi:hypothetical protein
VKDAGSATKADKVLNVYHSITERHALSRAETMPEINIIGFGSRTSVFHEDWLYILMI